MKFAAYKINCPAKIAHQIKDFVVSVVFIFVGFKVKSAGKSLIVVAGGEIKVQQVMLKLGADVGKAESI